MDKSDLVTVADYERRARQAMPGAAYDTLFGTPTTSRGVWSTNRNNIAAFDAIKLRPRVLVDHTDRSKSTQVLGEKLDIPLMLAPVGNHQRAHPEGELATARAAASAGVLFVLSNNSSFTIEEVAGVATGPRWFQIYPLKDRGLTEILIRRADQAGYSGLVVTVDNPGHSSLERSAPYYYNLKANSVLRNLEGIDRPNLPTPANFLEHQVRDLRWSNLSWLRSITSMPLIIKGIQTVEDALICADNEIEAIVVSNHGGHALDDAVGTAEILPEIVDAVGHRMDVYLDGGVRRGSDILKAMAMGAKAVLIGRPIFWGLAVDGVDGLRHELEILRDELDTVMNLCGVSDIRKVDRQLVSGFSHGTDASGRLGTLASLLDKGYLTRAEFEHEKARLLKGL
jgi:4-hydroxymandelate oxidase